MSQPYCHKEDIHESGYRRWSWLMYVVSSWSLLRKKSSSMLKSQGDRAVEQQSTHDGLRS